MTISKAFLGAGRIAVDKEYPGAQAPALFDGKGRRDIVWSPSDCSAGQGDHCIL